MLQTMVGLSKVLYSLCNCQQSYQRTRTDLIMQSIHNIPTLFTLLITRYFEDI